MTHSFKLMLLASGCGALAACGGDSSGGPRSTPIYVEDPGEGPVQQPSEAPSGSIGLVSDEEFTVLAFGREYSATQGEEGIEYSGGEPERVEVGFERRVSDGAYFLTVPRFDPGALHTTDYFGGYDSSGWTSISGTQSELLDGESGSQGVSVYLAWPQGPLNPDDLSYTSYGYWYEYTAEREPPYDISSGIFVYGVATEAAAMPVSGTASYSATVVGTSDQPYYSGAFAHYIDGTVSLLFDFGAGTLSGEMNPTLCYWDCVPLGTYTFIDTVYASGSNSFSGAFAIDGEPVDSWFDGLFTGPSAQELMALFSAPYTAFAGTEGEMTGTMSGIWLGRKD